MSTTAVAATIQNTKLADMVQRMQVNILHARSDTRPLDAFSAGLTTAQLDQLAEAEAAWWQEWRQRNPDAPAGRPPQR